MKLTIFTLLFLAVSGWQRNPEWGEEETNEDWEDYTEMRHRG